MSAYGTAPAGIAAAGLALLVVLTGAVSPGHVGAPVPDQERLDAPPERPEGLQTDDAVVPYDAGPFIYRFDPQDFIEQLGDPRTEDEEANLISLSTDILFRINSWELPDGAGARIAELVAEIPDGAEVQVTGHTDSVPTGEDFDNQVLSENRAEAVAEVLEQERPDLELHVAGRGDTEPAVTEDEEDPATFAANRRVEITYGD
ncbi:OmpA family protein [Nesterenkonia xinjiangensis]|uniref:Outer membrane protein OmpA-like peptidoglycan-associated protein n=1 Tax=Nesterenkonia xinjiangensis TaxID=225327 RepID=A0A7Z0K7N9_9MICC|nr:OmpA family protein [Nesterenkonia xinjiangensis]NYJ76806.1 outer membrane protein OmpA-like peptidoglycan-associated protein [Nesterenkonia xinjiangensis]